MTDIQKAIDKFVDDITPMLKQKMLERVAANMDGGAPRPAQKKAKRRKAATAPKRRAVAITEKNGRFIAQLPDGSTINQKRRRDVLRSLERRGYKSLDG